MLQWARNIIRKVEERNVPFIHFVMMFMGLLVIRLSFEFFSNHKNFSLADFLHVGLWFIMIVEVFILLMHIFSREKIEKIGRIVLTFFSIALTAPIFDVLISGGKGFRMTYLYFTTWSDFLTSYVTMGGLNYKRGATIGIRIEIFLLIVASFFYLRSKGRHILLAILYSLLIYTALFLSGYTSEAERLIINSLGHSYASIRQSTIMFLLTVDSLLLVICLLRHKSKQTLKTLKNLKWPTALILIGAGIIGWVMAYLNNPQRAAINPGTAYFPVLLLVVGGFALLLDGQLHDISEKKQKTGLIFLPVITGLVILSVISFHAAFAGALIFGTIYVYRSPAIRLYKIPVLANLAQTLLFLYPIYLVFICFGGVFAGFPKTELLILGSGGLILSFIWPSNNYFFELSFVNKSRILRIALTLLAIAAMAFLFLTNSTNSILSTFLLGGGATLLLISHLLPQKYQKGIFLLGCILFELAFIFTRITFKH